MNGKKIVLFVLVMLFFNSINCCVAYADVVLPGEPDLSVSKDDYYTYSDYVIVKKTDRYSLTSGIKYDYSYYIVYYNCYDDVLMYRNNEGYNYCFNDSKNISYMLVGDEWVYCEQFPFTKEISSWGGSSSSFESLTYYNVIYNSQPVLYENGNVYHSVNKYYGNTDLSTVLSGEFSISNISDIFKTYKYLLSILIVVVVSFIGFRKAFVYFKSMLGA